MPIYEYHCPACGAEFEALVPFAQADKVACESCGKPAERLASCCFSASDSGAAAAPAGCMTGA